MATAAKCVHKGCEKPFTDPSEPCIYHPGPPVFHEGQKGWKCCKPRVLTFEEFMAIPPCTTGVHSAIDDAPKEEKLKPLTDEEMKKFAPKPKAVVGSSGAGMTGARGVSPAPPPKEPEPESEDDEPGVQIPVGKVCRRKQCGVKYEPGRGREGEKCVHHPGVPIFHEGSKGYTCCKRRVLDFGDFLGLEGCMTKERHLFVGSGKVKEKAGEGDLKDVRSDYYQTPTTVNASIYLKKIDKATSTVKFSSPTSITLDLKTSDGKRYATDFPLYGAIDTEKSKFAIKGTKLEFELAKADGANWPVFRADDRPTGEIIQLGRSRSELERS